AIWPVGTPAGNARSPFCWLQKIMISHDPSSAQQGVAERRWQPERLTLLSALAAISALSWLYLIRMPMAPADLGTLGARVLSVLPPKMADSWLIFMMWAVMMVAMMLPSASPMILTYATIARGRLDTPASAPWIFAGSYVVVWVVFSGIAT